MNRCGSWSKRGRLHSWRLINNWHVDLWRWRFSLIWCFCHCLHTLCWWLFDHYRLSFNLTLINIGLNIWIWLILNRLKLWRCLDWWRGSFYQIWIKYILDRSMSRLLNRRHFMLFWFYLLKNWRVVAKYWILVVLVAKVLNWFL